MAKLVVNIKGQSEEFGLTDDVRDIGGNDYLTISNGNKKQYARLGNDATKLIIKKNNQKFYVQKDPIYFSEKFFSYIDVSDVYFPVGNYFVSVLDGNFSILKSDFYNVRTTLSSKIGRKYTNVTISHSGNVIFTKIIIGRTDISIKRV